MRSRGWTLYGAPCSQTTAISQHRRDRPPLETSNRRRVRVSNTTTSGLKGRVRGRSRAARARHGDNDLAACVAFSHIPDGLRDLAQRERPVDDGRELAGLEQLVQCLQVFLRLRRDPGAQLLTYERREH